MLNYKVATIKYSLILYYYLSYKLLLEDTLAQYKNSKNEIRNAVKKPVIYISF